MADSKKNYSDEARDYTRVTSHGSMKDAMRSYKSKVREAKYGQNWSKNKVNLNDIVKKFTPGEKGIAKGVKFEFENGRYIIKVDMVAGYLRIYDKLAKMYVKDDGTPSNNRAETHFKVKKRKEM